MEAVKIENAEQQLVVVQMDDGLYQIVSLEGNNIVMQRHASDAPSERIIIEGGADQLAAITGTSSDVILQEEPVNNIQATPIESVILQEGSINQTQATSIESVILQEEHANHIQETPDETIHQENADESSTFIIHNPGGTKMPEEVVIQEHINTDTEEVAFIVNQEPTTSEPSVNGMYSDYDQAYHPTLVTTSEITPASNNDNSSNSKTVKRTFCRGDLNLLPPYKVFKSASELEKQRFAKSTSANQVNKIEDHVSASNTQTIIYEDVVATSENDGKVDHIAIPGDDVSVNIVVNHKDGNQFEEYVDNVGVCVVYYCKKCTYSSRILSEITKHNTQCGLLRNEQNTDVFNANIDTCVSAMNTRIAKKIAQSMTSDVVEDVEMAGEAAGYDDILDADYIPPVELQTTGQRKSKRGRRPKKFYDDQVVGIPTENNNDETKTEDGTHELMPDSGAPLSSVDLDKLVGFYEEQLKARELDSGTSAPVYRCQHCTTSRIHNEIEFDLHTLCHNEEYDSSVKGSFIFVCSECIASRGTGRRTKHYSANDWKSVREHLAISHNIDFKLICEESTDCGTFTNHKELQSHHRTVHKYKCRIAGCVLVTGSRAELEMHEKFHKPGKGGEYMCHVCKWEAHTAKMRRKWAPMKAHLQNEHPDVSASMYSCQKCDRTFTCHAQLQNHLDLVSCDIPMEKIICKICGRGLMADRQLVRDHILKHSTMNRWADKVKMWVRCIDEGLDFDKEFGIVDTKNAQVGIENTVKNSATPVDISEDIKAVEYINGIETGTPNGESQAADEESDSKISESDNKDTASKVNYLNKPLSKPKTKVNVKLLKYKCTICYKKFATRARLDNHTEKTHKNGPPPIEVCESCGKKFRNKSQLRNHVRIVHLGIKRKYQPTAKKSEKGNVIYQCELCGYTTPVKTRLRNHHLSAHLGVMPYHCDNCNFKTNERSDLIRHKNKHVNYKGYKCEHCPYMAAQRWLLVNHCLNQHGIKMEKRKRDTMGTMWSRRRMQKKEPGDMEGMPGEIVQHYVIEPEGVEVVTMGDTLDGGGVILDTGAETEVDEAVMLLSMSQQ